MSIHAGSILLVGGNAVIDRLQSHGLGDANIPTDTIREIGNEQIVDKVLTEADFTFTLESLDTSCEVEALLTGKVGGSDPTLAPGSADPAGTVYRFADFETINLVSPWKRPGQAGDVGAGHIVPGFFPTRARYRFGVTDNASQEFELSGGSFYYGKFAPREEQFSGDGAAVNFVTSDPAVNYRRGGKDGTTFKSVFGVIKNGVVMTEGSDYTVTGGGPGATATPATVTFLAAPALGDRIRIAYFTTAAKSFPQAVHASTIVKPGAVRGRNICVSIDWGAGWTRLPGIQSSETEASVDTAVEREFCNEDIVGRTINSRDSSGTVTLRNRDIDQFFQTLQRVTGINTDEEVVGFLNQNPVRLKQEIQNPKNPGEILKTLYTPDAIFKIPGTPARVNTPTDFAWRWEAQSGVLDIVKGAMAG